MDTTVTIKTYVISLISCGLLVAFLLAPPRSASSNSNDTTTISQDDRAADAAAIRAHIESIFQAFVDGEFERGSGNAAVTTNRLHIMDVYAKRNGNWIQVASHTVVDPAWRLEQMSKPLTLSPQNRQQILTAREAVWKAYFANDPQAQGTDDPGTLAARRCVAAGRDPIQCAAEAVGKEFKVRAGAIDPSANKAESPGLRYEWHLPGPGKVWPHIRSSGCCGHRPYAVDNTGRQITIQHSPQPIVLTLGRDGRLTGSGAIQVAGRVVVGMGPDSHVVYAPKTDSCTLGTLSPGSTGSLSATTATETAGAPAPAAPSNAPTQTNTAGSGRKCGLVSHARFCYATGS